MVIDSAWTERSHTTGDEVSVDVLSLVDLTPIVTGLTVESPDPIQLGRRGSVWCVSGHLKGFESSDQRQPLHRVGLGGFSRRHVEENIIEQPCVLKEASKWSVALILAFPGWVEMSFRIKPVGRDLAYGQNYS